MRSAPVVCVLQVFFFFYFRCSIDLLLVQFCSCSSTVLLLRSGPFKHFPHLSISWMHLFSKGWTGVTQACKCVQVWKFKNILLEAEFCRIHWTCNKNVCCQWCRLIRWFGWHWNGNHFRELMCSFEVAGKRHNLTVPRISAKRLYERKNLQVYFVPYWSTCFVQNCVQSTFSSFL